MNGSTNRKQSTSRLSIKLAAALALVLAGLLSGCHTPITTQFYKPDAPPHEDLGYWMSPEWTTRGTVGGITVLTVYNCNLDETVTVDASQFELVTSKGDKVKILPMAVVDSLKRSVGPIALGFDPKKQEEVDRLLARSQSPIVIPPEDGTQIAIAYVLPKEQQLPDDERKKLQSKDEGEHFEFGDPKDPPEILRETLALKVNGALGNCPPASRESMDSLDPPPVLICLPPAPHKRFFTRDDIEKMHFNVSVSSDDFN